MRVKILSLFAAALLLAACETTPTGSGTTGGTGTGAAAGGAAATPARSGPVPGSQEDLVVNVGDRVFFDFDKIDVKPAGQQVLQKQAAWLKTYPNVTLTVEGHADERGTREYNLALADRRANSVKNYLVALGISANRVRTISYGKERPAVLGSNEAAWSQNRRGVSVVN
ncbi:MAG: peptidoglycan-associated lipoprotein Pal [Alphaproteobacteria bacterium]|nr:peptidoglycan-associated lipoprotein Pal [Alphaproteobacteria bacterium]